MFYAMYVHSTKAEPYAELIASGAKTIETRNKDTLSKLVGHCVGIIRTRSGHKPELIGFVYVSGKYHASYDELEKLRSRTMIPEDSVYNPDSGKGKWIYYLQNAFKLEHPTELPYHTDMGGCFVVKKNRSYATLKFEKEMGL